MSSVGAELPFEMARTAVAATCSALDGQIERAARQLSAVVNAAEALSTQDAIGCLRAYEELKALRS